MYADFDVLCIRGHNKGQFIINKIYILNSKLFQHIMQTDTQVKGIGKDIYEI